VALGTKNRQRQTAETCKQHLRSRPAAQLVLVEEFIRELEGDSGEDESADITVWSRRFSDERRSTADMLTRVDAAFEEWLNPK
jgi:hypothetical protein